MTLKQCQAYVADYQERFKLGRWEIETRWATTKECNDNGVELCGFITWSKQIEYPSALIRLNKQFCQGDIEQTIIHELLHLLLEGHKTKQRKYDPHYECALNILSRNL